MKSLFLVGVGSIGIWLLLLGCRESTCSRMKGEWQKLSNGVISEDNFFAVMEKENGSKTPSDWRQYVSSRLNSSESLFDLASFHIALFQTRENSWSSEEWQSNRPDELLLSEADSLNAMVVLSQREENLEYYFVPDQCGLEVLCFDLVAKKTKWQHRFTTTSQTRLRGGLPFHTIEVESMNRSVAVYGICDNFVYVKTFEKNSGTLTFDFRGEF